MKTSTDYRHPDLNAAETTGYGGTIDLGLGGSYSGGYGKDSCLTIDICPDLLFAALAAAAAAAFVFFTQAITMIGKRKRRSVDFDNREKFSLSSGYVKRFCSGMLNTFSRMACRMSSKCMNSKFDNFCVGL